MLRIFGITLALIFLAGCSSEPKQRRQSVPMNGKRMSKDDYYTACLKERSSTYCNRVLGKDEY